MRKEKIDMQKEDEQFYISLPTGENDYNIPDLIRWALKEIPQFNESGLTIEEFYLKQPYISGDKPSVYVGYSIPDEEAQASRKETLDRIQDNRTAAAQPEIEFMIPPDQSFLINSFVQRLPQGETQDNGVILLEQVAKTIEGLKGIEIMDLIYHEFLDDDGLDHPYVRVYFKGR